MKIIRNYKQTKKTIEEFPYIEFKDFDVVFAEMPICIAEYDYEYQQPVLYAGPEQPVPMAIELEALRKMIAGTKLFYFKVVDGNKVEEVDKEHSEFRYRLPVDTPVDKLAIIQGQLGLLTEENTASDKKEEAETKGE